LVKSVLRRQLRLGKSSGGGGAQCLAILIDGGETIFF
jgi:hypothetical protein